MVPGTLTGVRDWSAVLSILGNFTGRVVHTSSHVLAAPTGTNRYRQDRFVGVLAHRADYAAERRTPLCVVASGADRQPDDGDWQFAERKRKFRRAARDGDDHFQENRLRRW